MLLRKHFLLKFKIYDLYVVTKTFPIKTGKMRLVFCYKIFPIKIQKIRVVCCYENISYLNSKYTICMLLRKHFLLKFKNRFAWHILYDLVFHSREQ